MSNVSISRFQHRNVNLRLKAEDESSRCFIHDGTLCLTVQVQTVVMKKAQAMMEHLVYRQ